MQMTSRRESPIIKRKWGERMKKRNIYASVLLSGILLLSGGCATTKSQEMTKEKETGIEAMNQGDYEEAIIHFDKSIEMAGGKITNQVVDTCFYKAAAQYNMGEMEGAISQYTALMEYDKKDSDACFLRGSIYLAEKNEKQAKADYKEAIARNPEDYELYILIARNLKNNGYEKEAESYLQLGLEVEGDQAENYLGRGRIYLEQKEYQKAATQLKQIKDKSSVWALALQGDIAMIEGEYEKALSYYQKALEKRTSGEKQHLLRGEIAALEYTGDFEGAKEKAKAYLQQYPEDAGMQREWIFLKSR